MENNNNINQIKNPIIIKGDIFSEYLISNSFQNSFLNQDFAKPDNETFDKFFNNDENSLKSLNSLNEFSKSNLNKSFLPEQQQILDHLPIDNLNNIINGGKEKKLNNENINKDNNKKKKNLFNTFGNKEITPEEKKQKKLIMNRESAKKSRLKKKNYIENLEKQYILLKEEFIKIKEEEKLNNNGNNNNIQLSQNDNEYKNNLGKKNQISKYILEHFNIANSNGNNQKKLMLYLLINQIDIMTPIKIKAFQSKFLKMQILDIDDSIEVIKNKINMNLNIITELYGIETGNNNISYLNIFNNKKSIAIQLYEFYNDVKLCINTFEIICNNVGN